MAQVSLPHTLVAGALENVAHVQNNFTTLRDHINTALIGDDNLTSPNNSVWRPMFRVGGSYVDSGFTAATYLLQFAGSPQSVAGGLHRVTPVWHPVSADLAVAGKTTQVRVAADLLTNNTAPGVNLTIGLYPIATVGGAANVAITLGTVVASVAFTAPVSTSALRSEGTAVTLPAAGSYVFGLVLSGTVAANSTVTINAVLEMRHS